MTTQPQTVLDVLVKARKLIEMPENWGQGMRPQRTNSNSYCAAEAIECSSAPPARHEAFRALCEAASISNGFGCLVDWNDTHSHARVLNAFDRAIQTVSEQAKASAS